MFQKEEGMITVSELNNNKNIGFILLLTLPQVLKIQTCYKLVDLNDTETTRARARVLDAS